MLSYFKTRPDQPLLEDQAEVDRIYAHHRTSTFISILIGYSFFYTTRLSMSVGKDAMISSGQVDAQDLGIIGSVFFFAYAFGKFTNGFLSDRAHIGRLMSLGLFISSLCNLAFGWTTLFWVMVVIWAINGWFQSMGSAPSGTNISHWFSPSERGWRYSIWSMAQNFGEVISFLLASAIIVHYSWRASFFVPGALCLGVACLIHFTIKDRPRTYGLPEISLYKEDPEPSGESDFKPSLRDQLSLLRHPWIWILGASCATMYICRYAMTNWLVLYLQKSKGYDLMDASWCLSAFSAAGIVGTLLAGPLSDTLFKAKRGPAAFSYGVLLVISLCALFLSPLSSSFDMIFSMGTGFAIGGLLVFLGGLIAIDLSPPNSTGAALGFIGSFSYFGAAFQELVSGSLINAGQVDGQYQFDGVITFWITSSVISLLLITILWRTFRV
jgi:MFS transporter, OPA family, sugar phosphate sensor protein UhpC